jgi:hypothetical protein
MDKFEELIRTGVRQAIQHYWLTRTRQIDGQKSGLARDQGRRGEVTGGKQLDGFLKVIRDILVLGGIKQAEVFTGQMNSYLPGYFRPTKRWDLIAVAEHNLLASIEVKSQAGPSYGNNFNNRVEEAIGNAHDFWRAYQEKAFKTAVKPFLGYLMLLEHDDASTRPVREREPHFKVRPEFSNASYAKRYQLFCEKAFREGLYDATAFLMSEKDSGLDGEYIEPSPELAFRNLAATLYGRAIAYCKQRGGTAKQEGA